MSDPYFIIPGVIYLILLFALIYFLVLATKFMNKGIKTFDSIIKYLENKENEKD
ncbi:hypothetical protein [Clostridium sp. HBUAS56017]|uniref:hypothetical protein n=1 Tax=Clostridium sp. HBUAS56017 TaxID=2571128 RepID=UPI00163D4B44|nr:hypothetical protein [Clostridium sp. HBUAS56017]